MTTRKRSDPSAAMDELDWLSEQLNGPLINLDIIGVVEDAVAMQKGRAKGGQSTAKTRPDWHERCIKEARRLLDIPPRREPREIAGILAKQFNHDPKTIRNVLKKSGIR